jgi:UPF0271 protein
MPQQIDINSDVGERPDALRDGSEELLIAQLSSANIACGAHAGDEQTIRATVRICARYGVRVGAHPGYPDRENFGRREMSITPAQVERCVFDQLSLLVRLAEPEGVRVRHVKPHGALYHSAARDRDVAAAIGRAVHHTDTKLVLVGQAGSRILGFWREMGLRAVGEAFADRRYEDTGLLRSRAHADALVTSSAEAAEQALRIAAEDAVISVSGSRITIDAQTLCVHSDTPGALQHLIAIRAALRGAGISVAPFAL